MPAPNRGAPTQKPPSRHRIGGTRGEPNCPVGRLEPPPPPRTRQDPRALEMLRRPAPAQGTAVAHAGQEHRAPQQVRHQRSQLLEGSPAATVAADASADWPSWQSCENEPQGRLCMDHQDVDAAVAEMLRVLCPHTAEDWTVPAGALEWTCWQTAAHIGHDLLASAGQLAAQPADAYLPFDLNSAPTPHRLRYSRPSPPAAGCSAARWPQPARPRVPGTGVRAIPLGSQPPK